MTNIQGNQVFCHELGKDRRPAGSLSSAKNDFKNSKMQKLLNVDEIIVVLSLWREIMTSLGGKYEIYREL